MFLLKDRNATYYARYYFPKSLIESGFPKEFKFSLSTKERAEAIDRLMIVISAIRQSVSSYNSSESSHEFLNNLREQLNKLRKARFSISLISSKPISKTIRTRSTTVRSKRKTQENLLALFIESKRAEKLLPRSIQQLESRITALLKSAKQDPLNLIPKHVMKFRDELLSQGKSTKSVIEYLSASRQFYKWLKLRGDMPINPVEGITVKRKKTIASEERSRWTREQLTRLFKHPSFTKPTIQHRQGQTFQQQLEEYWIPLILLHSGARSSEICQLDVSDIKQIDSIWCIDINDSGAGKRLKSPSSKRIVPIHSKLIELGFLDYVNERRKNNLLKLFNIKLSDQNLDWSKGFARRFNKTLDELGFRKNARPTLHSFRHTFVDELQILQVQENVVADIVGHSKPNITFGRYGKRCQPEQLANHIKNLDFSPCLTTIHRFVCNSSQTN
ncbi:tyrosine-type recombinase/integrase [Vibrio parahaemolyticus]|uniref:tyrosine-type recombinase/integrase n=1 Tax=Vibrio parahaemolyticus TaxID=670 RepID=UPI00215186D7|nr:tyrosine-type recombinase/integrase [Vibrio parahaemolyticus]